jgi:hypothetical protein
LSTVLVNGQLKISGFRWVSARVTDRSPTVGGGRQLMVGNSANSFAK